MSDFNISKSSVQHILTLRRAKLQDGYGFAVFAACKLGNCQFEEALEVCSFLEVFFWTYLCPVIFVALGIFKLFKVLNVPHPEAS